jgi:valyl-tRNA synthetase
MRTGSVFKKLLSFQGDSLDDLKVRNPLTNKEVPVLINNDVTHDFGSGINIICPAHDYRSLEVAYHYNLPKIGFVDENGIFEDDAGILLAGIDTKDKESANKMVIEVIKEYDCLFTSYPF